MTGRMAVVTTAHSWGDPRVFERELAACLEWGVEVHVFVPLAEPPARSGWSAAPGLCVQADPERLFQVFSNLLGNALKFTPVGGVIEVIAEATGDEVLFRVCDNGVGIDPAQLPYIFDRYWTSRVGNPTGSGLGLYISHGIIEAHGGTLWAESVLGQGSVFSFRISAGG